MLVPFPFTDFRTLKQRPAVIISSNSFNRTREDIILVAITSNMSAAHKGGDYLLKDTERRRCGLPAGGVVLVGKIITIDQRIIRKSLGTLPPKALREITNRIHKIIG